MNAAGQVVGYADIAGDAATNATLWDRTTATGLNSF